MTEQEQQEQRDQERRTLVTERVKTMLDSLHTAVGAGYLSAAGETQRHIIGYTDALHDLGFGGVNDWRDELERISKGGPRNI